VLNFYQKKISLTLVTIFGLEYKMQGMLQGIAGFNDDVRATALNSLKSLGLAWHLH